MAKVSIEELLQGLRERDWRALARAVTIVENGAPGSEVLLDYAYQESKETGVILGITGAGGSGKSTLINALLAVYGAQGKTVGVLAVDPSSSYTGGAVLGDRVRMGSHATNPNFFIRSFASRGALGGISQGAKDVLYLYKAFGFDVIILESYGVGQAETDITGFVDVTSVVMAPGNGDAIQLAKAGTQEIADVFVVNKADKAEAEFLYAQMLDVFSIFPEESRPTVLKTVARDGKGIEEYAAALDAAAQRLLPNRNTKRRMRIANEIASGALHTVQSYLQWEANKLTEQVLRGEMTPFEASRSLSKRIEIK